MQKKEKIINKDPTVIQAMFPGGMLKRQATTINAAPVINESRIKGYPSFNMDIIPLRRIIH